MVFLIALLTASYLAAVVWVRRQKRRATLTVAPALPEDDQPPATAVGWPPQGLRFTAYVDEGFAALDAYLSEGYAA